MDTNKKGIEEAVKLILSKTITWIKPIDGMLQFIDPIDGKEISAHYGATHMAAALIVWGNLTGDKVTSERGISLLVSILDRWEASVGLPDFHFDFNNFALCVAEDVLANESPELAEKVRKIVLSTSDSNHFTVNWLPMRVFVNKKRYDWTTDSKYKEVVEVCITNIRKATNADGGIEDRLPKGTSFNLQYDAATVSVLQFLRVCGESLDLSKELGFLLNAVAPDGDINYQGRGTNQIFGWSCWLYLLASAGRENDLTTALSFLKEKLQVMLENENLLLNDYLGKEKHLWWDYHYASVYTAHLLFWTVLAFRDFGKAPICPIIDEDGTSGLHVYRGEDYFVASFDGRSEYLAEKGPAVIALWTRKCGVIFKGSFGPWQGLFGNEHSPSEAVLGNFWGAMKVKANSDIHQNKIIRKFLPKLTMAASWKIKPIFMGIKVCVDSPHCVELEYTVPKGTVLNFPVFDESSYVPEVYDEKGIPVNVTCNYMLYNQYTMTKVYRSSFVDATILRVRIPK